ncbi:hypothetical protein ACTNEO_19950 [Gracilibacillus sp. HCP3S3_G5_1]|uniref:hypothetical protein n=1 Tax=unclassified Gracilibacillus TaxID=2625209 RepID=UPI003F8951B5
MKVQAIRYFFDKKEKVHREENEIFEITEERFKQINSTKFGELVVKASSPNNTDENDSPNRIKGIKVEIKKSKDNAPKHLGGGYYLLSNGEKVRGKNKAIEAEEGLS